MSKFDYMLFTGGSDGDEFVVHAKKFSKREAIANLEYELYMKDFSESESIKVMELCDKRQVRYYPHTPVPRVFLVHQV